MIYGSACSGIEAATVAWESLGWKPKWFSEIDGFCNSLLKEKYPKIYNFEKGLETIDEKLLEDKRFTDIIVAGTPCQSFSINGQQRGLEDANGILALEFLKLAKRIKPRWIVWENVPGVLSCNKGRDFATILKTLDELGYGVCWQLLDAQYFGLPQRRRRVFVIGYLGDWRPAAAVLFSKRPQCSSNVNKREKIQNKNNSKQEEKSFSNGNGEIFGWAGDETTKIGLNILPTLKSQQGGEGTGICTTDPPIIRRLTITECERVMGFPDGYTNIKNASSRVRQKALGNSMAIPIMRWIGEGIQAVEDILKKGESMKKLCDRPDVHEKHEGCDGRERRAKKTKDAVPKPEIPLIGKDNILLEQKMEQKIEDIKQKVEQFKKLRQELEYILKEN